MHNNYFFIRKLSTQLKEILVGATLVECFSQNKDELIMAFALANKEDFYIQAHLTGNFSCLYFPKDFNRAKKNSVSLFQELIGSKVSDIIQASNERAFTINFQSNFQVLFKLFGNRSNIVVYKNFEVLKLFKNSLKNDKEISINSLNRDMDLSYENFLKNSGNIKSIFYTFGKVVEYYIYQQNYNELPIDEKYKIGTATLEKLDNPQYFITKFEGKIILSLLPIGEIQKSHHLPIDAINDFYHAHFKFNFTDKLKENLIDKINTIIKSNESYIAKSLSKIKELETAVPFEEIANIIMANLHSIPSGAEKATLFDFYRDKEIEVKFKKDLTPQKNAEILYRKAKNRPIEIERLKTNLQKKQEDLLLIQMDKDKVENVNFYKDLEPFLKEYVFEKKKSIIEVEENFKTLEFQNFKIFVGRNAGNNDELTQKFAHKEDLWLHAKDVAGSHVIIKNQPGKPFPKSVIERAASIAAFYSKRKNESLCPVIYTPKKFVRKVKGAAKGEVKVEKEKVIMVVPQDL